MLLKTNNDMQVLVGSRTYELSETLQSDELAPIFADAWTASRVWDASTFLSTHLVEFAATQQHPFNMRTHPHDADKDDSVLSNSSSPATVIELGSGCGLTGLVAASLGGDVVLTDQRETVELLQRNVAANAASDSERARLAVCEFTWGSDPAAELPRSTYDYILVSDCTLRLAWHHTHSSVHSLTYFFARRHQSDLRHRVMAQPRA